MVRLCMMVVGIVGLVGLAGCNQPYREGGYGNSYRPSSGGSYNRGYDDRNPDTRSYQQNNRGNQGNPGNRGGNQGGGGGPDRNSSGSSIGRAFGDPPANHPGN